MSSFISLKKYLLILKLKNIYILPFSNYLKYPGRGVMETAGDHHVDLRGLGKEGEKICRCYRGPGNKCCKLSPQWHCKWCFPSACEEETRLEFWELSGSWGLLPGGRPPPPAEDVSRAGGTVLVKQYWWLISGSWCQFGRSFGRSAFQNSRIVSID